MREEQGDIINISSNTPIPDSANKIVIQSNRAKSYVVVPKVEPIRVEAPVKTPNLRKRNKTLNPAYNRLDFTELKLHSSPHSGAKEEMDEIHNNISEFIDSINPTQASEEALSFDFTF